MYHGETADAIVDAVLSRGGFLTRDDLASFAPTRVDPISTTYHGAKVYQLLPSNQALIALKALNIADAVEAGDCWYESLDRIYPFAEATKCASEDGHRYIADPTYECVPPLTDRAYIDARAEENRSAATDVEFGVPDSYAEDADMVLVCAVDTDGNVVSFINSRFMGFESGIVVGDTGIALQNRGASSSLDPTHPNSFAPGKRPFHTLMPGVIESDDDNVAAFTVVGGYMQPQGHVQVISNLVDYGIDLQPALDAPRRRYRKDGTLAVEEQTPVGIGSKLVRRGHDVRIEIPAAFGGAQIARVTGETLSGASEPRTDGTSIGD